MDKTLLPCYDQALRYLSIREHNVNELKLKLKQKKYDTDIIDKVIDILSDEGSLSEERYIRAFISSSNKRHPEGKSMVLARLLQKGADRSLSKQLIEEVYTYEYTNQLIQQVAEKLIKKGKESEIRIKLAGLGFLSVNINEYLSNSVDNN